MYDVRVIEENGDQKYYHNVGVAFGCKDGSLNVKLYTQPGLVLNIKERKPKPQEPAHA
jgi:hypothetical protein